MGGGNGGAPAAPSQPPASHASYGSSAAGSAAGSGWGDSAALALSMQSLMAPGEAEQPAWMDQNEITNCPICSIEFSVVKRKHHCRCCGGARGARFFRVTATVVVI